jgi:hypothetical protein
MLGFIVRSNLFALYAQVVVALVLVMAVVAPAAAGPVCGKPLADRLSAEARQVGAKRDACLARIRARDVAGACGVCSNLLAAERTFRVHFKAAKNSCAFGTNYVSATNLQRLVELDSFHLNKAIRRNCRQP